MDDVAARDLALYGGPVSMPNLEELAASGVTFTNAYSHAWCAPTRRSLVFGIWAENGNGGLCEALPSPGTPAVSDVSIAEALPAHAASLVGKWHLGSSPTGGPWETAPLEHGWQRWAAGVPGNISADQPCGGPSPAGYSRWLRVDADEQSFAATISSEYHGIAVREAFVAAWSASAGPRLAFVCSQLPHDPLHAPPAALLPAGYPTPVSGRQKYEAMLRAFDTTLGQMLASVDLASTLVVVLGDNGTPTHAAAPGQANRVKGTVLEGGVHVPLVVAGHAVALGGRTSDALVHVVDVYATLLEACGASAPAGIDSMSFLPVLRAPAPHRSYAFLGDSWEDPEKLPNERGVVSWDGYKLRQLDLDGDGGVDAEELYDLRSDPLETVDLADASTVDDVLRAWIESEAP